MFLFPAVVRHSLVNDIVDVIPGFPYFLLVLLISLEKVVVDFLLINVLLCDKAD